LGIIESQRCANITIHNRAWWRGASEPSISNLSREHDIPIPGKFVDFKTLANRVLSERLLVPLWTNFPTEYFGGGGNNHRLLVLIADRSARQKSSIVNQFLLVYCGSRSVFLGTMQGDAAEGVIGNNELSG
jgi:hypothetical protein